jgi:hypothetical protein
MNFFSDRSIGIAVRVAQFVVAATIVYYQRLTALVAAQSAEPLALTIVLIATTSFFTALFGLPTVPSRVSTRRDRPKPRLLASITRVISLDGIKAATA